MANSTTDLTHQYVQGNGLRFHLTRAGTHGPLVLMLHGFPQHSYAWRHVMADLAEDHQVIALDLRGAGRSDAPTSGYDTATLTRDVLAVMDELGVQTVQLIGHEYGGWLALHVALADPSRVTSVLGVNCLHPWLPHRKVPPQMWRFWYTALFEYPWFGPWLMRHTGVLRWFLRRGRPDLPESEVEVYVRSTQEPARSRAAQQLHWQLVLRDLPRRVAGGYRRQHLSVPALLLAGEHDFAFAARSLTDAGKHADSLGVRVVDGGHYLPEERPDSVAAAARSLATGS